VHASGGGAFTLAHRSRTTAGSNSSAVMVRPRGGSPTARRRALR
jgi:hypothetical protein